MLITTIPIEQIKPYEHNPRQNAAAVDPVARSIKEFGWQQPLVLDANNTIVVGHTRLLAAKKLGLTEVPCVLATDLTPAQIKAYRLADNRTNELATWDKKLLGEELTSLQDLGFDLELTAFGSDELDRLISETTAGLKAAKLSDRFGAPPFSVLDTRQGYWQDRRREWLAITGNLTETKEAVLAKGNTTTMLTTINEGSSNFDPVLAELMLRWFCPPGGSVLDPFGGEQTKGVVAGELGLTYSAVEFRQEQVDVNTRACAKYSTVSYVTGDSENIDELIPADNFDLCFTSPPYYDLEVYSKEDMSALGTYAEFMEKYERIFAKCVAKLKPNSFLVIKVGEIRGKDNDGAYRNFVGDNIAMFLRLGLHYYNELILLNSPGTAPQRAAKMFKAARKMIKVHQNVLVFAKGSPKQASTACGEVNGMTILDATTDNV